MKTFRQYLAESNQLDQPDQSEQLIPDVSVQPILSALQGLTEDEIDELGAMIWDEFFSDDEQESPEFFSEDDIIAMLSELQEQLSDEPEELAEVISTIEEMIEELSADEDDEDDEEHDDEFNEGVTRRFGATSYNKNKRKYMGMSRSEYRQTRAARKRKARQTRADRKRYYRANRKKIAAYAKSRREAISAGKHKPKIRRPG